MSWPQHLHLLFLVQVVGLLTSSASLLLVYGCVHNGMLMGPPRTWTSAAAGFLDNVCTDIIHYEDKKLVHYPGNLSEFVKARCPRSQGLQVPVLKRPVIRPLYCDW